MFDKVLASVRIGGAEVDTRLQQETVRPGETLSTQVVVDGGEADQQIEEIELELKTNREINEQTDTYEISSTHVTGAFTIREDEQKVFEADVPIPEETPVTTVHRNKNKARVWIDTDLEIDKAIDADDTDYLKVAPTAPMEAMLDAVSGAGHRITEITVDNDRINTGNEKAKLPLDQEFVFTPTESKEYKELEIHFLPRTNQTHVLVEFDYKRRSEQFKSMVIDHDEYSPESLARRFQKL